MLTEPVMVPARYDVSPERPWAERTRLRCRACRALLGECPCNDGLVALFKRRAELARARTEEVAVGRL